MVSKTKKSVSKKTKNSNMRNIKNAGKTTLTEKLLLFGGAIQSAGAVKSNKIKIRIFYSKILKPIVGLKRYSFY